MTLLTLVAAAGWLRAEDAQAAEWNKAAFETNSMDATMKALGGGTPAQSKDIAFFQTPDIAENGAVVPIGRSPDEPRFRQSTAFLFVLDATLRALPEDLLRQRCCPDD